MLFSRRNRVRAGGKIACHDSCDSNLSPGKIKGAKRAVKRRERAGWTGGPGRGRVSVPSGAPQNTLYETPSKNCWRFSRITKPPAKIAGVSFTKPLAKIAGTFKAPHQYFW